MATKPAADASTEQEAPAIEKPVGKPSKQAAAPNTTVFRSTNPETTMFDILVSGDMIKSYWDNNREFLYWDVPKDKVERFKLHHHIVMGRIVEAK